jgi:hypothetical protein
VSGADGRTPIMSRRVARAMGHFELMEHTADVGVVATGETLAVTHDGDWRIQVPLNV